MESRPHRYGNGGGFTLVEVSLALLVVGVGLLAIFSLIPSGARSLEDDRTDTRCGLFAQTVLNGMRANASAITNWYMPTAPGDWCDGVWASEELRRGVVPNFARIPEGDITSVEFPAGGGEWLRFLLTLKTADSNRYWALLQVEDGLYPEGVLMSPNLFYTEFFYQGP